MNFLDRLIGYVSPVAGARRLRARLVSESLAEIAKRRYEMAAVGRRTDGWRALGSSANAEIRAAASITRNRARDLVRNNPYAARGVQVIASNVVGSGIIPQIKSASQARARRLENRWKAWAETTACDADGLHNIYGLQNLAMRTVVESGEVLIRRIRRADKSLPLPMQLQVIEPDFIDATKSTYNVAAQGSNYIVHGIEFSPDGKRRGYWLYRQHPGDDTNLRTMESDFVSADEVMHVFRVDRPGQIRGVTWLAPIAMRLKDFDEYEDAQLLRQKLAACFVAFITDVDAGLDVPAGQKQLPISDKLEPGLIEILPPGKKIETASPPSVEGYGEFARVSLHAIAVGLGVPYESIAGDLSQTNYSSGRLGFLEFSRNVDQWRWGMLIPMFCEPAFKTFLEACAIVGEDVGDASAEWTPPAREMIDPNKEIAAATDAVRSGQTTLSEVIRSRGFDPRKVLEERAAELRLLDDLGIVADSDPRVTSKIGFSEGAEQLEMLAGKERPTPPEPASASEPAEPPEQTGGNEE